MPGNANGDSSQGSTNNGGNGYGYGSNYGYGQSTGGYGGYGYGDYGGGSGGEEGSGPSRSIKDYLLIFRERIWWFLITFFVVVSSAVVYTLQTVPEYQGLVRIQILRDTADVLGSSVNLDSQEIQNDADLNTQTEILRSAFLIQEVAQRMTDDERKRFMEPYQGPRLQGPLTPEEVLGFNRSVVPGRSSLVLNVMYSHPYPDVAARVAQLFAEEYRDYSLTLNINLSMQAVNDLQVRAEQQRQSVEDLQRQLADYRARYGEVSIDEGENLLGEELQSLNQLVVRAKVDLDLVETRYNLVRRFIQDGEPLWNIGFISEELRVSNLLRQISDLKITVSSLAERYRAKHPRMMEAQQSLNQAETELENALRSSAERVRTDYEQARRNHELVQARYADREKELIELQQVRVEYNSLKYDMEVQQNFYQVLVARMSEEMANVSLKSSNARIIDGAQTPRHPYKPSWRVNLALGLFLGLGGGLGLVFLVAFFDDRVKTAYDIEGVVGLPLIGIVPRIKRLDSTSKAQAVASNADRHVTEAFRSLYSTLKLNDDSKNAQVIVSTSTVPGEGKSFVSSNLALTFANHGERTILVDADLRLPNVAKSLQIEVEKGVVNHIEHGDPLDEVIIRQAYPNLDILAAGGKAKNPTQILNSKDFEVLLQELRERYDRIILDSPPLAAVSDALSLLPMADGVVYVIKFNSVKKKTAKVNVRRMWESNTPVFGAILNNISANVSNYYYSHYYDRSYRDYYSEHDDFVDEMGGPTAAPQKPRERPSPSARQEA